MSDLRLLAILENIDKLEGAVSDEYLRNLCKQAAKEIAELNALRLRRGTQEPVAWVCEGFGKAKHNIDYMQKEIDALPIGTMLYTALPQRELQELTDEQIDSACLSVRHDFWSLPVRVQDYIRFQAMEWAAALEEARGNK
jgi:hypothetical protein